MSLKNYLAKSNKQPQEIRLSFDLAEIEVLYTLLKEIGGAQYHAFLVKHLASIVQYISLTPSQRLQKKWVGHPDILLIRFAALQLSESTVSLMNDLEPIADLVNRSSYRDFHAAVARGVAPVFVSLSFLHWPFSDVCRILLYAHSFLVLVFCYFYNYVICFLLQ